MIVSKNYLFLKIVILKDSSMNKELVIDPVYDLVKVLNDEGYQVLKIDEQYFSTTDFIPSDKNIPYHTMIGRHITKIIIDHLHVGVHDRLGLIQKIDALPEREIKFSVDNTWKWMIK